MVRFDTTHPSGSIPSISSAQVTSDSLAMLKRLDSIEVNVCGTTDEPFKEASSLLGVY